MKNTTEFSLWVYYSPEFYYSGFSEHDKKIESIGTSVPDAEWIGQGCGSEADQSFSFSNPESVTAIMKKFDAFAEQYPELNLRYEVTEHHDKN